MDGHSRSASPLLRAGSTLTEYRDEIEAAVQFTSSRDAVPRQLLSKIDHVISLAEKKDIPTTKFSVLLELLNKALQYSCSVSQNWFSLNEASVTALDNCDTAFKRFLRRSMEEESQAKEELESCEQFAEVAVKEAKRDCDELKERVVEEESLATLDELEQTHAEAIEMVASEKQALTEDRDQFSSDMDRIDMLLSDLVVAMDQSDVEYAQIMKELKAEAFSNRCHQERLREHLWRLEKEEGKLKAEMDRPEAEESRARSDLEEEPCSNHGSQEKLREELQGLEERLRVVEATASVEEFLQGKGDEEYHCTVEDISQWREELESLHRQAETSLLIVDMMSECVQLIMEDAKMKKKDWQQKLHDLKLKSLLQLRDSLMATASIHMIGKDDCAGDQVTGELESSSTGHWQLEHREGHSQHGDKVEDLQAEIGAIDDEIQALNPHLHLDTLEDRYEKRRGVVILVYEEDINAVEFCSRGNYSEKKHDHGSEDEGESTHQRKKRTRREVDTSATRRQRSSWTGQPSRSARRHTVVDTSATQKQRSSRTGQLSQSARGHTEVDTSATRRQRSSQTGQPSRSARGHTDGALHECEQCHRKFTYRSSMKRHMVLHTEEKPHQCEYCLKRFNFLTNLQMHILTHTGEKPHQCDYCKKRFTQRGNLQKHILTHTGNKPHQCEYCQKKFYQSSDLRQHIRTHTGEKPHQCDYCQKRFTDRSSLLKHIRTHTGRKPYQCEYCQKRFTRSYHLRNHMLTHTKERPHQCDYCQKRFNFSTNLQAHILTHTGEKPHQCEYCQKRFAQNCQLRAHILTHTGERPHQCDYCQMRFNQQCHLTKHIRRAHTRK